MTVRLSIIIVSWNVKEDLLNCLESIFKHPSSCSCEIIVVDNNSADGTTDVVAEKFPEVKLICNTQNLGFGKANNIGIKQSIGQYIWLLNPDTIVTHNSFDVLVNYMDANEHVGMCAPKILNEDGSFQQTSVRGFPNFRAMAYQYTICRVFGLFRSQYRNMISPPRHDCDKTCSVDQPMGASLLIRRPVIEKCGVFDERFFMYYEEVDLCYRIKNSEWEVMYHPKSEIFHLAGKSASQIPGKVHYMRLTSLMKFFKKHRRPVCYHLFAIFFKMGVILKCVFELFRGSFSFLFFSLLMKKRKASNAAKRFLTVMDFMHNYLCKWLFGV